MLTPPSCSIWVALSPSAPQVVVSIRRRVRFGTAESRFRRASLAATEHKRQPDHGNRAHCLLGERDGDGQSWSSLAPPAG
jgi:hypothetical protein